MDPATQEYLALALVAAIVGVFVFVRRYRRRWPGTGGSACHGCEGSSRGDAGGATRPLVFMPRRTRSSKRR
jgi:hypothetical protein